MASFTCQGCGAEFEVRADTLAKYPGWVPKLCLRCKRSTTARDGAGSSRRRTSKQSPAKASREQNLTTREVLERYTAGPTDGVFTDGAADPNPGPGGWGAVYVKEGVIVAEERGHEPHTTNNRMELEALIAGCDLVPPGEHAVLYSDSNLCVQTINEWASNWEKRGWKRKGGAIKNLELVRALYARFKERPELQLRWIAAHSGYRWNEYADALATAYRRPAQ